MGQRAIVSPPELFPLHLLIPEAELNYIFASKPWNTWLSGSYPLESKAPTIPRISWGCFYPEEQRDLCLAGIGIKFKGHILGRSQL